MIMNKLDTSGDKLCTRMSKTQMLYLIEGKGRKNAMAN